jgi:hypothetical protein
MSVALARLGWMGIGIESTPGVPVSPTDYIPYTANTLRGKHDPLADIAARGLREKDYSSVIGKQWGEGDVTVNLDPTLSGYFFKMALGSESTVPNGGTGVYDHTFSVAESSVPASASIVFDKVAYREIYPYSVLESLELAVSNGLATLKSTIKGQFPVTSVSGSNTTSSGTVFAFKDLQVQFGVNVASAQAAAPTKVTSFNLKVNNNVEQIFKSGSPQPDTIAVRDLAVSGEYGMMLESKAEVNNYYNLNKQCAIFTFTGRGIGGGLSELIRITLYNYRLQDVPIETGISNLFAIKSSLMAEYSKADGKMLDILCRNLKATTY